jgi:hypothetical protein
VYRFSQEDNGVRLGDVDAGKPHESPRISGGNSFSVTLRADVRQKHSLRHSGAFNMIEISIRRRPQVQMNVENGPAPLRRRKALSAETRSCGQHKRRLHELPSIESVGPHDAPSWLI